MTMGTERTLDGRGQPRMAGTAPGRTIPPGQGGATTAMSSQAKGPGRMLMIGVFVLSALVGGGAAGMFLAMSERQGTAPGTEAGTDTGATVAALEQAVGDDAATAADTGATQTASGATAVVEPTAQPSAEATTNDAINKTSDATTSETAGKTEIVAARAGADVEQLKALTDQVVAALGGAVAPKPAQAPVSVEELQAKLAKIVNTALAQGKSDDQIRQLLEEALDGVDEGRIPGLVRDASGRIDLRRLLAAILPNEKAVSANLDRDTKAYFNQLTAEASHTVVIGDVRRRAAGAKRFSTKKGAKTQTRTRVLKASTKRPRVRNTPQKRPRSRFFIQGGKRYTIVRKGDTLSAIASAAYGDGSAYTSILRANRGRISGGVLKPGTRILIPNVKAAKRQKRRKIRRQSGAPSRKEILQAFGPQAPKSRPQTSRSKVTPAGARPTGYRVAGSKGVKITNFRSRKKTVLLRPIVLYADAL